MKQAQKEKKKFGGNNLKNTTCTKGKEKKVQRPRTCLPLSKHDNTSVVQSVSRRSKNSTVHINTPQINERDNGKRGGRQRKKGEGTTVFLLVGCKPHLDKKNVRRPPLGCTEKTQTLSAAAGVKMPARRAKVVLSGHGVKENCSQVLTRPHTVGHSHKKPGPRMAVRGGTRGNGAMPATVQAAAAAACPCQTTRKGGKKKKEVSLHWHQSVVARQPEKIKEG